MGWTDHLHQRQRAGTVEREAKGRLRATIERGSFDIGVYLSATPSHRAIVPICLPFTMADGQRAVIMLGLSVDWLAEHLSTLKRPADNTIGIADRNGTTVARYLSTPRS